MEEYINEEAYELSLGQKQRVTIAGVISIKPKYIVMDEPTAMLDSEGKETVYSIVRRLKEEGYTIIYITNVMDEIFFSNRVIIMEAGKIVKEFQPTKIMENVEYIKSKGLQIPPKIQILLKLQEKNINIKLDDIL